MNREDFKTLDDEAYKSVEDLDRQFGDKTIDELKKLRDERKAKLDSNDQATPAIVKQCMLEWDAYIQYRTPVTRKPRKKTIKKPLKKTDG